MGVQDLEKHPVPLLRGANGKEKETEGVTSTQVVFATPAVAVEVAAVTKTRFRFSSSGEPDRGLQHTSGLHGQEIVLAYLAAYSTLCARVLARFGWPSAGFCHYSVITVEWSKANTNTRHSRIEEILRRVTPSLKYCASQEKSTHM